MRPRGPRAASAPCVLAQAGDTARSASLCWPTVTETPSSQTVYAVLDCTPHTLPWALPLRALLSQGRAPTSPLSARGPVQPPTDCGPVPPTTLAPSPQQPRPAHPAPARPRSFGLTFPEVLTPFHRLKYSKTTTSSRQAVSCQRGGPRSSRPRLSCRCSTPRLQGEGVLERRRLPPTTRRDSGLAESRPAPHHSSEDRLQAQRPHPEGRDGAGHGGTLRRGPPSPGVCPPRGPPSPGPAFQQLPLLSPHLGLRCMSPATAPS